MVPVCIVLVLVNVQYPAHAEEAASEHAHEICQYCVIERVLRVFDVVVMDEAATGGFLLAALLGFVQVV